MAHTSAGDLSRSSEEQNVEMALKNVTRAVLTGVMIIDHWEHPERNELFSLARMDLAKFKENLDLYKDLSQEVRDLVKQRADKLHEELEQEILRMDAKL